MLAIPSALRMQFEEHLRDKSIKYSIHGLYKKWLQYYLDFCLNYHFSPVHQESLSHFIHKLGEKNQTKVQQEQALMAIKLYYEISDAKGLVNKASMPQPGSPLKDTPFSAWQDDAHHEETVMAIQKEMLFRVPRLFQTWGYLRVKKLARVPFRVSAGMTGIRFFCCRYNSCFPVISTKTSREVSGYPLKNRREARKLGLLPRGKSFEAGRERMEPLERNERVFQGMTRHRLIVTDMSQGFRKAAR